MNRFDKNFNDVDPITSRPFSSGHPDGVWFISIVYSLPIFIPVTIVIVAILLFPILGSVSWSLVGGMILVTIVNSILFIPIIVLMFRRSVKAIHYAIFLFLLSYVGLLVTYFLKPDVAIVAIGVIILQSYTCYYLYGLKKDLLIK